MTTTDTANRLADSAARKARKAADHAAAVREARLAEVRNTRRLRR